MKTEGGRGRGGLREKKKSAFAGLFAIFPLLFLASNNHPFFPRCVVSSSVIFRAKVHISSVPCLETEKGDQKKSTKGTQRAPREWLAQQIIVVIAREKKKKIGPWRRCRRCRPRVYGKSHSRRSWRHLGTGGRLGPFRSRAWQKRSVEGNRKKAKKKMTHNRESE